MDFFVLPFVRSLRNAEVEVSPAETLDAFAILDRIGVQNPSLLKDSLSLVFAKSKREKELFSSAFDRFFAQFAFTDPPKRSMLHKVDTAQELKPFKQALPENVSAALSDALEGRRDRLSNLVQSAAEAIRVDQISTLREKQTYALQIKEMLQLQKLDRLFAEYETSALQRYLRQYLHNEIDRFVTTQYEIHVDPTGRKSLVSATLSSNLGSIPRDYLADVRKVVERIAERLVKKRRRRRVSRNRGEIDIKRTLRRNIAYDGALFDIRWRSKKKEISSIYILCDVSQSVASVARFMLLLLFQLVDLLPKIRAFAFSSSLGEVTETFQRNSSEQAIEEALFTWGKGNTDYGRALRDFQELCGSEIDKRSTVILLGDGRNNFYEPAVNVLKSIKNRVNSVYWLNPEPRDQWDEGDSEMKRYESACTKIRLCNRIEHLERFADELLEMSQNLR